MSDALVAGWVLLCLVMLVQRRLKSERLAERAPCTWLGIVVQALGFSAVWILRRADGVLAHAGSPWVAVPPFLPRLGARGRR